MGSNKPSVTDTFVPAGHLGHSKQKGLHMVYRRTADNNKANKWSHMFILGIKPGPQSNCWRGEEIMIKLLRSLFQIC